MISTELIDAVYPNDETKECHVGIQESERFSDRVMWFGKGGADDCRSEIDIYRVAHDCKIWALEHDCQLLSCIKSKDRAICDIYSNKYNCKFTHYAETEPEAVFKACSWILEKIRELKC